MIDVNRLASEAHDGNDYAYTDLVEHYMPRLQRKASYVARQHRLDEADVMSEYLGVMRRCIDGYDAARGDFEHLVNVALNVQTANLIVTARRTKQTISLDALRAGDGNDCYEGGVVIDETTDVEAYVLAELAACEVLDTIRAESAVLERVALLLAAGYSLEGVARECGQTTATKKACETWTSIMIERIREILRKKAS